MRLVFEDSQQEPIFRPDGQLVWMKEVEPAQVPGFEQPSETWYGNLGRGIADTLHQAEASVYSLAGRGLKTVGAGETGQQFLDEAKRLESTGRGLNAQLPQLSDTTEAWSQGRYLDAVTEGLKFGASQAVASSPWMGLAAANFPAFIVTFLENQSRERARNQGRDEPTWQDVMEAAPATAMSAALERFGLKGLLGAGKAAGASETVLEGIKRGAKEWGKATLKETGTETLQEPLEYAATNVGTAAGADWEEARMRALGGALGGFAGGGAVGAVTTPLNMALQGRATGLETGEILPPGTRQPITGEPGEQMVLPLGEPTVPAGSEGQQLEFDFQPQRRESFALTESTGLVDKGIVRTDSDGMVYIEPARSENIPEADADKVVTFDRSKVLSWEQAKELANEMGVSSVDLASSLVSTVYEPQIRAMILAKARSLGYGAVSVNHEEFSEGGGEEIVLVGNNAAEIAPRVGPVGTPMEQQELPLGEGGGQLAFDLQPPPPSFGLTPPPSPATEPVEVPLKDVVGSLVATLRSKRDAMLGTLTQRGQQPLTKATWLPNTYSTGVPTDRRQQAFAINPVDPNAVWGRASDADLEEYIDAVDTLGNPVASSGLGLKVKDVAAAVQPGTIVTQNFFKAREVVARKKAQGVPVSFTEEEAAREEAQDYKVVVGLVKDLMRKYTPDGKIIVQYDKNSGGGYANYIPGGPTGGNVGRITVGPLHSIKNTMSYVPHGTSKFDVLRRAYLAKYRASLIDTTAHEFGHYLFGYQFSKASPEVQNAILQEYENWLKSLQHKTFGQMLKSAGATLVGLESFQSDYGLPANANVAMHGPWYWLNFDEFVARRTADFVMRRISLKQFSPLTSGFWRTLGYKLKHLFNNTLKPWAWENSSLEYFLDSLSLTHRIAKLEQSYTDVLSGKVPSIVDPSKLPESPTQPEVQKIMQLTSTEDVSNPAVDTSIRAVTGTQAPTTTNYFESLNRIFGTKLKAGELGKNQARFNWFMKAILTLPQIERENWTVPGVRPFVDAARRWWGTKGIWTAKWDAWVDSVRRNGYGKAELSKLWRFANEVTVLSDELGRKLTPDELAAEARKVGGLDDGLMDLWKSGRVMLTDALAKLEQLAIVRINATWNERIAQEKSIVARQEMIKARDEALKESEDDFRKMKNRDYWPLARFGTYAVHVKATVPMNFMGRSFKPGETMLFELFETEGEQLARKAELLRAHKDKVTVAADRVDESIYSFMGLPPTILRTIEGEIMSAAQAYLTGDETVDADTLKMMQDQLNALRTAMLHFTPENAFKQRLLRRKGTRGFTDDGLRAMASLGQSFAGHIARSEHRGEMDEALKILDKHRKGTAISEDPTMAGEGNKLSDLLNYLRRSQRDMMNPGNDLANLRAAGFLWYLGAVPRAAVVQVMQPIFTTYPWLASRYGDTSAMSEMAKGYTLLRQMLKGRGANIGIHLEKALKDGVEAGILNQSLFTELAGLAEGSNMQRLLPGKFLKSQEAASMIRKAGYYASYLFQKGEEVNRLVTFRAAYMLELRKLLGMEGATEEEVAAKMREIVGTPEGDQIYNLAYTAGRSATEMTQGEYARWARPELMRGKKSAIFLFKMYSQIMNYFAIRDPGKWRFLGIQLAIAGALGLPFAEDLLDILNAATQGELCKTGDIRNCVREYVQELGMNPELAMHGLARVATPWDLSGSMSLGRVVPTVEPLTAAMMPGGDIRDSALRVQSEALGALFSIPLNWVKAVSSGEERDIEQAMPTVVRDVYRTYRRMREGGELSRSGEMVADIDWGDPLDVMTHLAQAAGFRPAEIAGQQEMRWSQKEAAKYWGGRREAVVGQFYHLYKTEGAPDREALADVLEAVKAFNDSVPYPEMKISGTQLRKGLKLSLQRKRLGEEGVAPEKKYRRLYSEVAEGFTY